MREALRPQGAGQEADVVARAVRLAPLAVLAAAFAVTLAAVLADVQPVWFDADVASFATAQRRPWLTSCFEILTWLGSTAVLVPLGAVVGVVLRRATRSWRPLLILAASLAGASALSNLTKLAVARARPEDGLVDTIGYAFPSGHSTAAAAGWIALAFVVAGVAASRGLRLAVFASAVVVIAIVGASRIYLGAHWSTDVLGGWALGGLWVGVVLVAVSGRGARLRS